MRFFTGLAVVTLVALGSGSLARAGELAIEGQGGYFSWAASSSASAVFGSTGGGTFGGGLRYTVWRGVFVSAGVRRFSAEGQRVFVATPSAPVQELGFPLSVRITPIFATVGYRFFDGGLVVPYLGIGGSVNKYSETSEVAEETFDESFSKSGFHGVGGVEVGRGLLRAAAEASYSTVSGAVGLGGVTQVYGEDDIGGWTVVGKVIVAFGGK
jgi:hypothetical protein